MSADLVIFDCDGVLVDSEAIVIEVESEILTQAGFPMSPEQCADLCVGLSWPDVMRMMQKAFGRPVPPGLSAQIQRESLAAFPDHLRAIAGMATLLESSSVPRCVASSSDLDRVRLCLDLTDLSRFFGPEHVFSAQMVSNGKPAPDLFLHAAAQLHVSPDRCVVIEDSPAGVTAARAAGMDVIGFTAGAHARPSLHERLASSGASVIVDNPAAIRRLLS